MPRTRLIETRKSHQWSQQELADMLGTTQNTVSRWERGEIKPNPYFRTKLCTIFGQSAEALDLTGEPPLSPPSQNETGEKQTASSLLDPTIPLPFTNSRTLIGREELLAETRELIGGQQGPTRVALTGLPGVGKTTLAVALANDPALREHFRDGILWLGLGPHPNVTTLLSRWGRLLGISQEEAARLRNQQDWLEWLQQTIGTRQMLLVIDDVWTIEEALTCLVGGPNCSYVLTTRLLDVALQFAGLYVMRVPELDQEASRQLLVQLAPVVAQASKEIVQALVQAIGGLPLALTLLGQHILVHTGKQPLQRLQRTLTLLLSLEERMQVRQPQAGLQRDFRLPTGSALSLQAIIELSEAGLPAGARRMLSALAVFPPKPGSFAEEAALAVTRGSVQDLDQLVNESLIELVGQERYTLHPAIADYIRTSSPHPAAQQQMARYYHTVLTSHTHDYPFLEIEAANLLQALHFALEHNLKEIFLQSVIAFVPFLLDHAMHQVVEQYLVQAEQMASSSGQTPALILLLLHSAETALWLGNYEKAEVACQKGLQMALQQGDTRQQCQLLLQSGKLARQRGEYEQAERCFQEGLTLARDLQDHETTCKMFHHLGALASERGEYEQAERCFQEGLTLARQIHSEQLTCQLLNNLAAIAAEQARFAQAEQYWLDLLPLVQHMRWYDQISITFFNLGCLMRDQGKLVEAEQYYQECLALDRKLARQERLGHILVELSILFRKQGAYEQAWASMQEGLELARKGTHPKLLGKLCLEKGELSLQVGQVAEAEQAFHETLEYVPKGEHAVNVSACFGLARVAALQGKIEEARQLGETCLEKFAASGYFRSEEVRSWLDSLPLMASS